VGIRSRFHVWRSQTHFLRYRGRRVPFSCFVLPDSFSVVPCASCPVFMISAPGHISGGTEGVGSRFHVFRSRTSLRRYRGHRVPFSCFACPDSFSTEPRASNHIFMFSRTRFRRYRGYRVPFSCFARWDSFSTVPRLSGPVFIFCVPGIFSAIPRVSGPVFMFCAHRLVLDGSLGVGSRFHVLRYQTRFRRYRGSRVPFSCFARPDSFSVVPAASSPVFLFCAP
jgi:hypothetical protein